MPSPPATPDWYTANQRYLITWLRQIRRVLERYSEQGEVAEVLELEMDKALLADPAFATVPPALVQLCQIFRLSSFERAIVLLCLGMEFEPDWGRLCARAQNQPQSDYPTFNLALCLFRSSSWSALTPDAPLRHWRLIEIGAGQALAISPIRLDEQIVHYLAGLQPLDWRSQQLGAAALPRENLGLVPSHQGLAEQMATCWVQAAQANQAFPLLQLWGPEALSKRAIAATACQLLGLDGYALALPSLPRERQQLELLGCLWQREWWLHQRVILLDCDLRGFQPGEIPGSIPHLIETLPTPLILTGLEPYRCSQRPILSLEVHYPTAAEQRQVWQTALGELPEALTGQIHPQIERLVAHFNLSPGAIAASSWQFKTQSHQSGQSLADQAATHAYHGLWDICRAQARPRLDELAQRIEAGAGWEDLVLPSPELKVLQAIAVQVRQRTRVYDQWGFAAKGTRGLGISALFAGASGTGKTLAAEVLGNALDLDVYRIDLSAVVSKYIGETEKNLRRVFDAAEAGGVILLFDEADALFGKRTEVKDSHDRHANIEVSYLLQRMETYRGLAILTTNLKTSLDQAFMRRIRFVVQFPFPDAKQRSQIWQRAFPAQTPTAKLDFQKLAKLNVAGGNIRNIALNAAFLAADANEPVGMQHLLEAAKSEYIKLERPLTDLEVKGWVDS